MEPTYKILFAIFCVYLATVCNGDDSSLIADYLQKYSSLNVEEIMKNDRLFQTYYKCFMDKGVCSPEAKDMKTIIPTLVKTACGSCTLEQKKEMKKHFTYVKNNRQAEWEDILTKYDPTNENLNKFLSSVPDK